MTIVIPSGRLLYTDCWKCGLKLHDGSHSCDGFADPYASRACDCPCHEAGRS